MSIVFGQEFVVIDITSSYPCYWSYLRDKHLECQRRAPGGSPGVMAFSVSNFPAKTLFMKEITNFLISNIIFRNQFSADMAEPKNLSGSTRRMNTTIKINVKSFQMVSVKNKSDLKHSNTAVVMSRASCLSLFSLELINSVWNQSCPIQVTSIWS